MISFFTLPFKKIWAQKIRKSGKRIAANQQETLPFSSPKFIFSNSFMNSEPTGNHRVNELIPEFIH
ncbi:hypothetical protein DU42_04605 [Methanosarcina mazei]|uniref:Uncharacterized protein n=1 Tax=Methanosarcina mazei TaxID=2209 RepID=A0A0F8HW28_METMZ|nr:hypothetical protein DU61_05680 [Methanosarcina mazei]KKH10108.1 hypothetical protein DU42_04605 [Methanosarcina mazei]